MKNTTITPETILDNYSDMNRKNILEAMKEFAGIKIIEAIQVISEDYPNQSKEMIEKVDCILEKIL